jgi:hypothetical protein
MRREFCYRRHSMRQLPALLLLVLVALSMVLGSAASAMEPGDCLDKVEAARSGHANGDGDQVPADFEKAYPHHHGASHDHQIGEPARSAALTIPLLRFEERRAEAMSTVTLPGPDPGLRPPQV